MAYMNTETEINITLDEIREVWMNHPYLRFGQLVVDVLGTDPFYMKDDVIRRKFREFNKNPTERIHYHE